MGVPAVPAHLVEMDLSDADLADLWHQLCVEIMDNRFSGRTHHNRRTYDSGCHGPLCCKAVREFGRRRSTSKPSDRYKFIDPLLDAWLPIATDRILAAREAILRDIAPAV